MHFLSRPVLSQVVCTIALAWQQFADMPVVLAANRDELFDRPAQGPARRNWGRPVVAPKDEEADGTWIGYNDAGVLVTITNRWDDSKTAGERSRGLLVRDALGCDSAEAAVRYVERELDDRHYEGFHLLVADSRGAFLIEYDGTRFVDPLEPGLYVIVNVGVAGRYAIPPEREEVGAQQAATADQLRAQLQPAPGETGPEWRERARALMASHEAGVCIHRDGFGTRSSSLVSITEVGVDFAYADGPPCTTEYRDVEITP